MINLHIGGLYQITHENMVDRDEWKLAEVMDKGAILRFVDPKTNTTIWPPTKYEEFERAFGEKRVRYIPFEGKGHRLGKAGREDLPPVVTDERAPLRLAVCEIFDDGGFTKGMKSLDKLVAKVFRERPELLALNYEPPSGTVGTWLRERGVPGCRLETEMINRSGKVPRKRRRTDLALEIIRRSSAWYYSGEYRKPEQAWAWACKFRKKLNAALRASKNNKLATVCETITEKLVRQQIREDRCYETVEMKWGEEVAIGEYKGSTPTITADEVFERVIIDGTQVKVHIVDIINGRYLGRPWVVYAIDVKTKMPLGWVIMFSHESVQFAIEVLRHVVLPKLDLKERFGLQHEAEAFGTPVVLLVDNRWAQTGAAFKRACRMQGIRVEWAPIRNARYKPIVERFVRTMNTRVYQRARGGIGAPPQVLRRLGLNPLKDKSMTMSQLVHALNKACVDDYPYRPHKGLGDQPPIAVWQQQMEMHEIETIDNPNFLDGLGKVIRNRTLTRHGITYDGLQYGAEPTVVEALLRDLQHTVGQREQRQMGSSRKAKTDIVRDPGNIHRITVYNTKTNTNFTLTVRGPDSKITEGMSEGVWEELKKYAKRNKLKFSSPEDRAKVVDDMRMLLQNVDPKAKREELFRYQRLRDGMPKPSLQGDMVTVVKVPSGRLATGQVTIPIDTGPALAAAVKIPQPKMSAAVRAERKRKERAKQRIEAAIEADKTKVTPNGSPAAFSKLQNLDEAEIRQFRNSLGADYHHPDATPAAEDAQAGTSPPSAPETPHDNPLTVEDPRAFRASLSPDYAIAPDEKE